MAKNFFERMVFSLGRIATTSGTLHSRFSVAESVSYIASVYDDYRTYSRLSRFGGRVVEIGPGDNSGVGILFRADGCTHVDLIDRFYSSRDSAHQAAIYKALGDRYPAVQDLLRNADFADENVLPGLERHYGASASAEKFFLTNKGYDLIVSRAVCEHLYDPVQAMRAMTGALNPGGLMLHKIDLRDHDLFSTNYHDLKWLEVPDWAYRGMTAGSGRPNRVLANRYRELFANSGIDHSILVTHLVGVGDIVPHVPYEKIDVSLRERAERIVESIRPRLAKSLRDVPARDLATTGIFLIVRIPATHP